MLIFFVWYRLTSLIFINLFADKMTKRPKSVAIKKLRLRQFFLKVFSGDSRVSKFYEEKRSRDHPEKAKHLITPPIYCFHCFDCRLSSFSTKLECKRSFWTCIIVVFTSIFERISSFLVDNWWFLIIRNAQKRPWIQF